MQPQVQLDDDDDFCYTSTSATAVSTGGPPYPPKNAKAKFATPKFARALWSSACAICKRLCANCADLVSMFFLCLIRVEAFQVCVLSLLLVLLFGVPARYFAWIPKVSKKGFTSFTAVCLFETARVSNFGFGTLRSNSKVLKLCV